MKPASGRTFDAEVRELAGNVFHGRCWICEKPGQEFHHRVSNSVVGNRLYPNFLHSVFNCCLLCRDCHANRLHEMDIPDSMARAYELYLKGLLHERDGKKDGS